jgi:hypothetical protein
MTFDFESRQEGVIRITKYLLTRTLVPPKSPFQVGWEKRRITPSCLLSKSNVI